VDRPRTTRTQFLDLSESGLADLSESDLAVRSESDLADLSRYNLTGLVACLASLVISVQVGLASSTGPGSISPKMKNTANPFTRLPRWPGKGVLYLFVLVEARSHEEPTPMPVLQSGRTCYSRQNNLRVLVYLVIYDSG